MLRAVALSPNATLEARLIAAEKAYRAGALTAAQTLWLYLGIPFSQEELNAPITAAEENWSPRTRALILRSAASQKVPLARAEVLRRAWQIGRERDSYAQIAGPSVPLAGELFAGGGAELVCGRCRTGAVRRRADRRSAGVVRNCRPATGTFRTKPARRRRRCGRLPCWPIRTMPSRCPTRVSPAWYDARRQADPEGGATQARTRFALMAALGRPLSAAVWQSLLNTPFGGDDTGLNVAWQSRMDEATARRQFGEVVLLAAIGAGGERRRPAETRRCAAGDFRAARRGAGTGCAAARHRNRRGGRVVSVAP